jgi:hypothetical protein
MFPEDRGKGPPTRERGHWCTGHSHHDLDRSLGGEDPPGAGHETKRVMEFRLFHIFISFWLLLIHLFPLQRFIGHNIRCQPLQ